MLQKKDITLPRSAALIALLFLFFPVEYFGEYSIWILIFLALSILGFLLYVQREANRSKEEDIEDASEGAEVETEVTESEKAVSVRELLARLAKAKKSGASQEELEELKQLVLKAIEKQESFWVEDPPNQH